ncbi:hypothetical protein [Candidatus Mesenet endosymbiont of Phosphuga atrata]|uniref:hypothetical protein n=1 Tax=Candidatus Mesenet endosymbiont of Phosphuga atrata TaxID=3066221 RepID=UPI0030CB5465
MWCCANGETNICLKLIEEFNANPFIEDKCKKNILHLCIVLSKVNDKGIMNNFRRGKMAYSVDLRDYL